MEGYEVHDTETSCSIKDAEFVDQLSGYYLLKNYYAPLGYLVNLWLFRCT